MKRKQNLFFTAAVSFSVFVWHAASANCVAQDLQSQNLQTSAANQTQFYGQWKPPGEATQVPAASPTKDRFRELFPTTKLQPIANRIAERETNPPPLAQQPAPVAENIPRARPLQPIGQSNFLRGTFSQEPNPGGDFVRVNHNEASTADAVMPLPNAKTQNWHASIPQVDNSTQPPPWLEQSNSIEQAGSELEGIVGSMQSGGKDLWSKFQAKGGWGEKIAGFFGGQDDRMRKVFGSLAVVIGGYLSFVWLMRKFNFSTNRGIPSEVIEVIGNAPFGPRKNLQLVRLGSKLLLLMSGPEGTHPVGEITDAQEVEYLISLCKGKGTRATSSIMSAVKQISNRGSAPQRVPGRTVHPTSPAPAETTFSTTQLVQALETIQNSNRSHTVFEA